MTLMYDLCVSTNLLTAAQVAERLGVSKRRVLAMIEAGRLKGEKLGVQWFIAPKDLAAVRHRKVGRPKSRRPSPK